MSDQEDKFIETIDKHKLSNSQFYDKAILTLSSTGFIFSLSIVTNNQLYHNLWLLYISWACFIIAISTSLASFQIGNKDLQQYSDDYFAGKSDLTNKYEKINIWLNWITPISLFIAVVIAIIFIILK